MLIGFYPSVLPIYTLFFKLADHFQFYSTAFIAQKARYKAPCWLMVDAEMNEANTSCDHLFMSIKSWVLPLSNEQYIRKQTIIYTVR